MKKAINRFFNYDDNSFFHVFIHAGFVMAILMSLAFLWISFFMTRSTLQSLNSEDQLINTLRRCLMITDIYLITLLVSVSLIGVAALIAGSGILDK